MPSPCLFVSKLAVAAGLNPYGKRHHYLEDVWSKTDPTGFRRVFDASRVKDHNVELKRAVESVPSGPALCAQAEAQGSKAADAAALSADLGELASKAAEDSADVMSLAELHFSERKTVVLREEYKAAKLGKAAAEGVAAGLLVPAAAVAGACSAFKGDDHLASLKKKVEAAESSVSGKALVDVEERIKAAGAVKAEVCKVARTTFGSTQEADAIALYEAQQGITVRRSNRFFKASLTAPSGAKDTIAIYGGRVDGLIGDDAVLEVKNRTRKIFDPLPTYELVQVQAYMQLLARPRAILLQCLKTRSSVELHSQEITRDDVFWQDKVLPPLSAFVSVLTTLMQDTDLATETYAALDDDMRQEFVDMAIDGLMEANKKPQVDPQATGKIP